MSVKKKNPNPIALALVKLRNKKLSPARRKAIAETAAAARWKDHAKVAQ